MKSGLDTLEAPAGADAGFEGTAAKISYILVESIRPSPFNRRSEARYTEKALAELTATVREAGVIQPVLARALPGEAEYELIAGHRRLYASRFAGRTMIPVIVLEADDARAAELCALENIQREGLSLSEECDQVAELTDGPHGLSNAEAGLFLGKSASWVALRVRMTKLIPDLRALLDEYPHPSHWELVARLSPEQQEQLRGRYFLNLWQAQNFFGRPVKEVRADLFEEFMMDLDKVPWDLDDADLVPAAGSCAACPKRAQACAELFPELAKKKGDTCTDSACFKAKHAAALAARVQAVRAEHPEAAVFASDYRLAEDSKVPFLAEDELKRAKAKRGDKGARLAVDVATGATHFLKASGDLSNVDRAINPETDQPAEARPAAEKKSLDELLALHEAKRWKLVSSAMVAAIEKAAWPKNRKMADALRLVICCGLNFAGESAEDAWKLIEAGEDPMAWFVDSWKGSDLRSLRSQVARTIDYRAMTLEAIVLAAPDLARCAAFFGMDLKAMKAKADKACPLPKHLAALVRLAEHQAETTKKKKRKI